MNLPLIDIHSHGVRKRQTVISVTPERYPLYKEGPGYLCAGLHPWNLASYDIDKALAVLQKIAEENCLIAMGECGIDRKKGILEISDQKKIFERQVEMAETLMLPIIVHSVRAHSDILSVRKRHKKTPWVIHGFIGNQQEIRECLRHNIRISPGFALLHYTKNNILNHDLYRILPEIPPEYLYLETDGVDIFIEEVYRMTADRRNIPVEDLAEGIQKNFSRDFLEARNFS